MTKYIVVLEIEYPNDGDETFLNLEDVQEAINYRFDDRKHPYEVQVLASCKSNFYKVAEDILKFLDKYAVISPNNPEEYTSPDAHQLLNAANCLKVGILPKRVWSEWGSGGYKPYNDKQGKEWHDKLLEEISNLTNTKQ